jgi:transposase
MSTRELKRLHIVRKAMDHEITQKMAAEMLEVSERQVRRWVKSVREEGDGGIGHRGRGRPSNRRLPAAFRDRVVSRYREAYPDFGPTLAAEKLWERDGLTVNRETLRRWLQAAGLWEGKGKKRRPRQWRPREACVGGMIQMDGSHHAWLEDRGPKLVLMAYMDDATGRVFGRFYDYEGTIPALDSFKQYVRQYGLPVSLYLDRHTTYKSTRPLTIEEELAGLGEPMSQFERAMDELGVRVIHARSPQAKGRVERLFGTLQDRLVKEMRLEWIATTEEANAFLPRYLPRYNRQFSVAPANPTDLHVKPSRGYRLDHALCLKTTRTVKNDYTVAYHTRLFQITQPLTSRKVTIEEWLNGSIHITCNGVELKYRPLAAAPRKAAPPQKTPTPRRPSIPAADHPWRRRPLKSLMKKQMYSHTPK